MAPDRIVNTATPNSEASIGKPADRRYATPLEDDVVLALALAVAAVVDTELAMVVFVLTTCKKSL